MYARVGSIEQCLNLWSVLRERSPDSRRWLTTRKVVKYLSPGEAGARRLWEAPRKLLVASPAICVGLLLLAPGAAAQGGTTVETAPLIASGETVSGDTASDSVITNHPDGANMNDAEVWRLNVLAGDTVFLKGEVEAPGRNFEILALPPGVTDAELTGVSEVPGTQRGLLEYGLSFSAPKSGTWLIVVGRNFSGIDGAYKLIALVSPGAFSPGAGGGTTVETAPLIAPGETVWTTPPRTGFSQRARPTGRKCATWSCGG